MGSETQLVIDLVPTTENKRVRLNLVGKNKVERKSFDKGTTIQDIKLYALNCDLITSLNTKLYINDLLADDERKLEYYNTVSNTSITFEG